MNAEKRGSEKTNQELLADYQFLILLLRSA